MKKNDAMFGRGYKSETKILMKNLILISFLAIASLRDYADFIPLKKVYLI